MTKTDNTRFLTRGNEERRQATRARARAAIEQLDSDGRPVTFSPVAQTGETPAPGSTARATSTTPSSRCDP